MCKGPCPGVSPAWCLCSSHFHFVHRMVYEAQGGSLMQVDVLGAQIRHPCISQKAGLRVWCSLAKPAGTLIPAVQLRSRHLDKYFCGASHFSTMHCCQSPDFSLTTHHGRDSAGVFQGKGKLAQRSGIFPALLIRFSCHVMPDELLFL